MARPAQRISLQVDERLAARRPPQHCWVHGQQQEQAGPTLSLGAGDG
ncbi:MAG: hypothetical protein ACK5GZ_00030 [Cyanobium sp.]